MPAVTFLGDGLELVLTVEAYEYESAEDWDLDWLTGSARLVLDAPDGAFSARVAVSWRADELARFAASLRAALGARRSRNGGIAELSTLEDQIELEVIVRVGEAQIRGRIEHELGGVEFGWLAISAVRLDASLRELVELTRQFPSRG